MLLLLTKITGKGVLKYLLLRVVSDAKHTYRNISDRGGVTRRGRCGHIGQRTATKMFAVSIGVSGTLCWRLAAFAAEFYQANRVEG